MISDTLLLVIAIAVGIYWMHHQKVRRDAGLPPASPREMLNNIAPANAELEREVIELRKRIEVLERIATDRTESRRLAEEIDALRGK